MAATIGDLPSSEPRGSIGQGGVWFSPGKQNGCEKHGQAGDGGVPTVPQAEGQNDEGSTGDGEQEAEGKAASAIAAKIQERRQEQVVRKESTEYDMVVTGND